MTDKRLDLAGPNANQPSEKCCMITNGERCPQAATKWIGSGYDDYTHLCDDHAVEFAGVGDEIRPLRG